MTADQMPAEAVGKPQGPFQVDPLTGPKVAEYRPRETFRGNIGAELAGAEGDHGETDAIDGDAVAEGNLIHGQGGGDGDATATAASF